MVAFVLGVTLLAQQLQASARVNPDHVLLGDTIVLSLTVQSRGDEPLEITNPTLSDLEVQGSREQSQVTMVGGRAARITRRDLTLRTIRTGTITIPPFRVRQADETVATVPVTVTVTAAGAGSEGVLGTHVRELIARTAAPRLGPDEVGATVLVSEDSVLLGDQLDLVVVAWFPRAIRSRLRNPPTLRPPQLQGAWSYERPSPSGIAMSRRVGGVWYDLFVHHQAVFPLTVGIVNVGTATVSYSLPLTYSFLSRELRHEVETPPLALFVRAPPESPVPGFQGAAGTGLSLRVSVAVTEVPLGGAVPVIVTVSGGGNVALWPEPSFSWPPALRVYPGDVEIAVSAAQGRLRGTKTFHYLAVADSVGSFRIPPATYVYFDTERRRYSALSGSAIPIVVRGGAPGMGLLRTAPPPLMSAGGRFDIGPQLRAIPWWAWLLAVLVPPALAAVARVAPRIRLRLRTRGAARRQPVGDALTRLEREFVGLLSRLVADASVRDGEELADALRAAGIEGPVAAHAARVRERLRLALYGPSGTTDPSELAAEVQEVLRAMLGTAPHMRRSGVMVANVVVLFLVGPAVARAQSPEQLYQAGAVRAAADSFVRRAEQNPNLAAHWYNLGSALYQLGDRVGAEAAWVRAARLRPRHELVAQALELIPADDRTSEQLTWVAPVVPGEALLICVLLWGGGWLVVGIGGRWRHALALLALAVGVGGYGVYVSIQYARPVAIVRRDGAPLREAPFGSAPASRSLNDGSAVLVERRQGPWLLVRRGPQRGWLLEQELVRL